MKFKKNYYLSKEDLNALLTEAGIKKVDFIVPYKDNAFNYIYRVRADGNAYLLKIQKENNKMLTLETNKMQNDVEAYKLIEKETDNTIPTLVYTNADYIDKEIERPHTIFSLYKFILATPYSKLSPNGEERKQFYFLSGQIMGDFTNIKTKVFGSPSVGFDSNWFGAFTKMINALGDDEKKFFKKESKDLTKLKEYVQENQALLITVKPTFVHFNINKTNLYYLNRKVDMIISNPGEYFFGDFLMDLGGVQPLTRLEKKVYMIEGFNDTCKNVLRIDNNIKIRYYLCLMYRGIVLRDKTKLRHYPLFDAEKAKALTLSKAILTFANAELKMLLNKDQDNSKPRMSRRYQKLDTLDTLIICDDEMESSNAEKENSSPKE